jgi:hypothetical protein
MPRYTARADLVPARGYVEPEIPTDDTTIAAANRAMVTALRTPGVSHVM